jgi:hypothetical protein
MVENDLISQSGKYRHSDEITQRRVSTLPFTSICLFEPITTVGVPIPDAWFSVAEP